jgi:hypothetical protein
MTINDQILAAVLISSKLNIIVTPILDLSVILIIQIFYHSGLVYAKKNL